MLVWLQEGGLLDVLAGDDYGAVCAGVRCVCSEGDASFLLDGSEDVFTLVHTTGEREYVLEQVWLEVNQVHMTADELRVQFQSSSCSLLVQMAEVNRCGCWGEQAISLDGCGLLEHGRVSRSCGWIRVCCQVLLDTEDQASH